MQAYAKTDTGRIRTGNQDYYLYTTDTIGPLPNLFLVADGMGGHNAGDFASRFCVEGVAEFVRGAQETEPLVLFRQAIAEVNARLLKVASKDVELAGTGTTLVAATLVGEVLYVANIGDSRLYVAGEKLRQITKDHSYVERMVELGKIERFSPEYWSSKNMLTRAMGVAKAEPDLFETQLQPGEQVLICSDGLCNMVEDDRILELMKEERPLKETVVHLIEEANQNGGRDNITALIVQTGKIQEELC